MELKDKYGDYGLVGAAILEKKAEVCVIDTLLMSCRVLGRDAETALIALLAEQAAGMGCGVMTGQYAPTAKNDMVRDLYQKHGMIYDFERDAWTVSPASVGPVPMHIRVTKVFGADG
jgi:FkbH-like protein